MSEPGESVSISQNYAIETNELHLTILITAVVDSLEVIWLKDLCPLGEIVDLKLDA